jgi:glycosyltransferase domain-containing protein
MSNLLLKLTLVIPTYNRQRYALRNMRYWSGRSVTVHILDGSPRPISKENLMTFGDNVNYHHLPVTLHERFEIAVELVATEYSMMLGDDEFFIPSALESCLKELEIQEDLVSCMGRCMVFIDRSPHRVEGYIGYPQMEDYAILQNDPVERMVVHMNPYTCSTVYAVTRTPVWKKAMSIWAQREFPPFNVGEVQFELAICYQGKSKVIPTLMWLRSTENIPQRDLELAARDENYFIEGWWLNTKKKSEHAEFLEIMGGVLAKSEDQVNHVIMGVTQSIDAYVKERLSRPTTRVKLGVKMRAKLVSCLPKALKQCLRTIRNRYYPSRNGILAEVANDLLSQDVRVDFEELAIIEGIIFDFHKNH